MKLNIPTGAAAGIPAAVLTLAVAGFAAGAGPALARQAAELQRGEVLLPVLVCQDGFTITHSAEPVELPDIGATLQAKADRA